MSTYEQNFAILRRYWKEQKKTKPKSAKSNVDTFKQSVREYYKLLSDQQIFSQHEKKQFCALKFSLSINLVEQILR